jgi:NitT/TauT family transport system substrate-binding protein
VDASIVGWNNFLYGDRSKAYELILKDNPDMSTETLDGEIEMLKKLEMIDSGDTLEKGIGAISLDRVKQFYDLAVKSGIVEDGKIDISRVATDVFVNKGVGLDLKKQLNP